MKKDEITTEPVQTQFDWHVIKLDDRRPLQPLKRTEIEEQLRAAVSQEIGTAYLKELRQTANIKQFNLDGSPLMVKPIVK